MEEKLDLGLRFLIEKTVKPLPSEQLFKILIDDNCFDNDHLSEILDGHEKMEELSKALKKFNEVTDFRTNGFDLSVCSEKQLEILEWLRESYSAEIEEFTSYFDDDRAYENYLEALLIVSLFYHLSGYFLNSEFVEFMSFCKKNDIFL